MESTCGGLVSDPHCRGIRDPRQRRCLHSHRYPPALQGQTLVDTGGLLPAGPQLIDTARTYAASNGLLPSDKEYSRC